MNRRPTIVGSRVNSGKSKSAPNPNLPIPEHLAKKFKDPKSFRKPVAVAHEWDTTPPPEAKAPVTKPAPKPVFKPKPTPVAHKPVNNLSKPPPAPIPQPKMEPGSTIKKVITTVNKDGSRKCPEAPTIKPAIDKYEIDIPIDYEVEEVDYDDYAQG
jgi:hypothetical protein